MNNPYSLEHVPETAAGLVITSGTRTAIAKAEQFRRYHTPGTEPHIFWTAVIESIRDAKEER